MREEHREWVHERGIELQKRPVWIGEGNIIRQAEAELFDALRQGYETTPYPYRPRYFQLMDAFDAGYEPTE